MASPEPRRPSKHGGYGWMPDLPDARDHLYAAPPEFLTALPPRVDLRGQCPAVYDQGQLGVSLSRRARSPASATPTGC